MDKIAPIGVFDSGIGGLTVLRELRKTLPGENFLYLGDTARVPYGPRGGETVQRYSLEAGRFLQSRGIKYLVVACNTATAHALSLLREKLSVPVLGVIEPGARAARRGTGPVGVLGTEGTVESLAYPKALKALGFKGEVVQAACPLFVPLVEEGWEESSVARKVAQVYLTPLQQREVRAVILGCTHYPVLEPVIRRIMGDVEIINPAQETARIAREELSRAKALREEKEGRVEYMVTDDAGKFQRVGNRLAGVQIDRVEVLKWKE